MRSVSLSTWVFVSSLALCSSHVSAQSTPGAPTDLTASVAGNQVTVSWNAPVIGPALAYSLVARAAAGAPVIGNVAVGNTLSVTLSAPDGTYFITVRAFNAQGLGPESNGVTITVPSGPVLPPGAPQNLTANTDGTTVSFTWSAPSSGGQPSSYTLVASLMPGGTPIAQLPLLQRLTLTLTNVPSGTYYVRMVAVNAAGSSAPSNEVRVDVAPPQPPGPPTLSALVNGNVASFAWTPSGASASFYTLLVTLSPTGPVAATVPVWSLSFTVPNVPNGIYYVRVAATNAAGTSAPSNQVTVTIPTFSSFNVTVRNVNQQSIGGTSIFSSTRLAVSWTERPAQSYQVIATKISSGREVVNYTGATELTLTGLEADTEYAIVVRACGNINCSSFVSAGPVIGRTSKEHWQFRGTGNSVSGLTQVVSDGNARLSATRFGSDAGAMASRIQLYYGPSRAADQRLAVATASAAADATNPSTYLSFTSRSGSSGIHSPSSPSTLVSRVATGQGVPLTASMGGRVRLFFEALGADNRTRVMSLDSQDGYVGQDFNAGAASICSTTADYSTGGGCVPTVAIGVEGDAVEGNANINNARQFKLGWPILESTHWDGAAGTFMVFTTDAITSCTAFRQNHAYAVWTGTRWSVQYALNGCPKLFTSAQAAFPMHLGGVRYKMYYGDPSITTGRLPGNLPFLGPKKLIYADGQISGATNVVDFEDWESQTAARDVVFLWPNGEQMDDTAEGYIDDYHFLAPTGSLDLQVMYVAITDGLIAPISAAAVLLNP